MCDVRWRECRIDDKAETRGNLELTISHKSSQKYIARHCVETTFRNKANYS
jgi:hypothetical protein